MLVWLTDRMVPPLSPVLSCDWLRSVLSSNNGALPLQIWKQYIIQRNNELFLQTNYVLHRWREQNFKQSWKAKKKIYIYIFKKCSISASSITTTTKLMRTWKLMFPLSRFFAAWFYPPLKGSRWAIPPDARLCRGAPPRCAHRDGVDAESGTGRRVTFWHCKGSIPSQLRQRPSSCGAPRPQASFLVSQPVCVFVRACVLSGGALLHKEAEHPCPAKSEADRGNLASSPVAWMSVCLSVPRLRGTNAAGLSATSALHQSRVVFAVFDVMLRCIAHVKGEWDRLASSWVAISRIPPQLNCDPINGSFGTIADICNYRRRKAVAFSQAAPAFRRAGISRFDLGFQTASAVQCVDLHEYHI